MAAGAYVLLGVVLAVALGVVWTDLFTHVLFAPALLQGKRVVVCGASMGIGEQIAYQYAQYNTSLVLIARKKAALEHVAARCLELGATRVDIFVADMGVESAVEEAITGAIATLGGIDVLVLNHLYPYFASWLNHTHAEAMQQLKSSLAVNVVSYISAATLALPHLLESQGSIIVVSSATGKVGAPYVAPYSASKHALHGFFDSLRQDLVLAGKRISITISVLGPIQTDNARNNTKGYLDHLSWYPASECASSVVKAGAIGMPESYYPSFLYIMSLINGVSPSIAQYLFRMSYQA